MPIRTITQEICDVCYDADSMSQTPATDRLRFSWQGRAYVLLVCDNHVRPIRDSLEHWSDLATEAGSPAAAPRRPRDTSGAATLFSQLDSEEKEAFRAWAAMPSARRIADERVRAWIDAGKPTSGSASV